MNGMPAAVEMNVAEGPEAQGARRATGASGPLATLRAPTPDPEVPASLFNGSPCVSGADPIFCTCTKFALLA
jgi:hypothetical protein